MDRLIHTIQVSTEEMEHLIKLLNQHPELQTTQKKIKKALEIAMRDEKIHKKESDEFATMLKRYFPQPNTHNKSRSPTG